MLHLSPLTSSRSTPLSTSTSRGNSLAARPGAYYIRKASDPALATVWLLFLEGGDWCYSSETCSKRFSASPQYMSSQGWPGLVSLGGIFSSNPRKSPWAGANKIYAGYCSRRA